MLLTPEQIVHLGCIMTVSALLLGVVFLIACDTDVDDAEKKEKQEKEKQRHYDELKEWRSGFQKELDDRDEDASREWLLREQRHYPIGIRDRGACNAYRDLRLQIQQQRVVVMIQLTMVQLQLS